MDLVCSFVMGWESIGISRRRTLSSSLQLNTTSRKLKSTLASTTLVSSPFLLYVVVAEE